MAKTLGLRAMRAVGTLTGGPPVVRNFTVSANVPAAGGAIGDVCMWDDSVGKFDVADYNDTTWLASANNDQIDDDKITQSMSIATTAAVGTNGDSLLGILLGPCTASQTAKVPVAVFHSSNVFEANLTSWVDGDTPPTALVGAITHLGKYMYICAVDPGITYNAIGDDGVTRPQTTVNGIWVLSDTQATGTTANVAKIIDIGYGVAGESVFAGHGVIGDSNVRVRFIVEPGVTFMGC